MGITGLISRKIDLPAPLQYRNADRGGWANQVGGHRGRGRVIRSQDAGRETFGYASPT